MTGADDVRSETATDRLLEDSWDSSSRRLPRREVVSELVATALFVVTAGGLLLAQGTTAGFDLAVAALLLALYVVLAGIEFPVGAGNFVPTQLVLVPMFALLAPATVPLLVAAGLLLARLSDWLLRRGSLNRVLFSIPDAWHALGPAAVLVIAGAPHLDLGDVPLLLAAFVSCCLFDAGSALLREAAARGIAPALQLRVLALVWLVDACLAPIGLLAAEAAARSAAAVLLVLPLAVLLSLLARDRGMRIEQAQRRLKLAIRERGRLQLAVRHMGDAFAARLELAALIDILLRGSMHALDADTGCIRLAGREPHRPPEGSPRDLEPALRAACDTAMVSGRPERVRDGTGWALALPFAVDAPVGLAGAVGVARRARAFQEDEVTLLSELVTKAQGAAASILGYETLREQAVSDPLTGLGNRRKMAAAVSAWLHGTASPAPRLLMLLDLDGFKMYNDTFGHQAGDALLERLGARLRTAVAPFGEAYRLGGDEFCALLEVDEERLEQVIATAADALAESGDEFSVRSSYGVVLLPHEADSLEHALQLADRRMYAHKQARASGAGHEARDVLMRTMYAKEPWLQRHSGEVAQLARAVAQRLGMRGEELDEVTRAAELHDIGKVAIPDAILNKPATLDAEEWALMHQHTILGERILAAASALRPIARIVRASHERWDGAGYPDGLRGSAIPRGARVVAVCDAYEAMTSDRPYRRALAHDSACAELRAMAGSQFDPEVVEAFAAEVERRGDAAAEAPDEVYPPVEPVVDHVRALLQAPRDGRGIRPSVGPAVIGIESAA